MYTFYGLQPGTFPIGPFSITVDRVNHPVETYGVRVEHVVAVQVREHDRVDAVHVRITLERGQRTRAEIDQQPEALGLDKIGGTRRLGAGKTAGTAENGQSHAGPFGSRWVVHAPVDRSVAESSDQSITERSVRRDLRTM